MNALMRKLAALICLFTLAACGQGEPPAAGAPPAEPGSVTLGSTQNLPDWLFVARQRDCLTSTDGARDCQLGEVHFNQRTITRNEDGTADIWIQVRHGHPQVFEIEDATTTTTVRYEVQRMHYRFNCATEQFVVIERQIMGAADAVVARDEPRQIYRAPIRGSVTQIIMPIACRGA
jgi:predicted small lipoprotein YifL